VSGRPLALIGFMGAGKSTVARILATDRRRPLIDVDDVIERDAGRTVAEIFAAEGEAGFRRRERAAALAALDRDDAPVLALGGGAVLDEAVSARLRERGVAVWLDVPGAVAWERVRDGGRARPLAGDRAAFGQRLEARQAAYAAVSDAVVDARAPAGIVAAAVNAAPITRAGALGLLQDAVGDRAAVLVADRAVAERVPGAFAATVVLDGGEKAKSPAMAERLWRDLSAAGLGRRDLVVCCGGGTITDVGGFAAATFRRGLSWIAVPSTLVGQVDAAIGGKTGLTVEAKNDVGAFHRPEAVLSDLDLLATLPPAAVAEGMAEVVKTALLAGGRLWDLVRAETGANAEIVARCAGFKALVVAEDPREQGRREILNLGHTIGHGIESAAGWSHGRAVAVGLAAALDLSVREAGLDPAAAAEGARLLARAGLPLEAPGCEPSAVLAAMRHDKKRRSGADRFVLLRAPGRPRTGVELSPAVVEAAVRRAVAAPG
jgi:shikimate kinase/3-dehydroquinate synthase